MKSLLASSLMLLHIYTLESLKMCGIISRLENQLGIRDESSKFEWNSDIFVFLKILRSCPNPPEF